MTFERKWPCVTLKKHILLHRGLFSSANLAEGRSYKRMMENLVRQDEETASKAMFALLSKGRVLQLPVDIMLEMFNKTVLPIMLYTAARFGVLVKKHLLDTVFLKFCKVLLGLKLCTPSCMVYGELGCYPVSLTIQIRIISYWLKLASFKENKICRKLYELLFNMSYIHTVVLYNESMSASIWGK